MVYMIDDLIAQHWAGCDVLQGETPEAYAMRHERARLTRGMVWWRTSQIWHTAFLRIARSPDE